MRRVSKITIILLLFIIIVFVCSQLSPKIQGKVSLEHRLYGGSKNPDIFSAVISDSGQLYVRGSNHLGDLIPGKVRERPYSWTPIMDNVASFYHDSGLNFALTFDGTLYGWGCASYKTLTDPNNSGKDYAVIMEDVIDMAIGSTCMALKSNGELWAWGICYDDLDVLSYYDGPTKIADGIRSVYAADMLNFIIDEKNQAYVWGKYNEKTVPLTLIADQTKDLSVIACDKQSGIKYTFQLLTLKGDILIFDIEDVLDNSISNTPVTSSVRMLCSYGYITHTNELWHWYDKSANLVAKDVLSAECSAASSIYITHKNILCLVDFSDEYFWCIPLLFFN